MQHIYIHVAVLKRTLAEDFDEKSLSECKWFYWLPKKNILVARSLRFSVKLFVLLCKKKWDYLGGGFSVEVNLKYSYCKNS